MATLQANPTPDRPSRPARRRVEQAFIGLPEAAIYLGVTEKTIRRRIADGTLPAYRFGNRVIKIRIEDIDSMLTPLGGAV